jgi:hypothetical protein
MLLNLQAKYYLRTVAFILLFKEKIIIYDGCLFLLGQDKVLRQSDWCVCFPSYMDV